MQHIQLSRKATPFYCPVTGEQLLYENDYHSSAATLFHFIDIDGGKLIDEKPEFRLLYNEALEELLEGKYKNYNFKFDATEATKAFDILVHVKLKNYTNSVLFELCDSGTACGPISNSVFIGIDMGIINTSEKAEIDLEAFTFCFSGFENYESVLFNATKNKPSLNGYALFMEDTMGCGGFYFINNEEEWTELLPALVLLDYINQEYNSIPIEVLESLQKVYLEYFNAGIYDQLTKDFTIDLNAVLSDYKIVFFGKVADLFETKSGFSKELLEAYGTNPNEDIEGFLSFLSSYSKF
jgi:hypothetical protein